jgi:hypothetical protein
VIFLRASLASGRLVLGIRLDSAVGIQPANNAIALLEDSTSFLD